MSITRYPAVSRTLFCCTLSENLNILPGALHLPWSQITAERMKAWPEGTLFVVYCAGPHCNGADRAALKLARLGLPVKVMLGGMTGWEDERFAFAGSSSPAL
jgi:rhodanese-related sulfurtransferase